MLKEINRPELLNSLVGWRAGLPEEQEASRLNRDRLLRLGEITREYKLH